MAGLYPASVIDGKRYHLWGKKDKKMLPERKSFALTVSALVRDF
jgi:hypothetical protein